MQAFAELLDALAFHHGRNDKLRLLERYLRTTADPDRGWALAALTGGLDLPAAKPAMVRALVNDRVDPVLFALSYDFVGDLAETVALIWPSPPDAALSSGCAAPRLADVVDALRITGRAGLPAVLARWLDMLDANGRWALIKLVTGGFRVGVSARLARVAVARVGARDPAEVEEVWHGLAPPYADLFAWLEGRTDRPAPRAAAAFRPVMLAHPLADGDLDALDPADFAAEWKWDGIRVQAVAEGGERRLYSRNGDDLAAAFPDLLAVLDFDAAIDGELLVLRDGVVAPFADLQKRLNRKVATPVLMRSHPAAIRAYDLLVEAGEDLRPLPFSARRARLEAFLQAHRPARIDLSPLVAFTTWDTLAAARAAAVEPAEGVMLKRIDSPYLAGRPRGPWFKWKREPRRIDAVLMYAQRGHGRRSSFYSDYTFGVWRPDAAGGQALVPVGKAYSGFTDEELVRLDAWVREHARARFGPVREVAPGLVLEVAFEGIARSSRHRSGIALRFPRIARIRWDKPAAEADSIAVLEALLPPD